MRKPTIHLNGTSREELQKQLETAVTALTTTLQALTDATPHARDYYPQGNNAWQEALNEHRERYNSLVRVRDELMMLLEYVVDA